MRIFHGLLWFLTFTIAETLALSIYDSVIHPYYTMREAFEAGHASGYRYGPLICAVAAVLAILGTKTGVLPGTKRPIKRKRSPIVYQHPD